MSFSTPLRAEYCTDFINSIIDGISVEKKEDCEKIKRALQTITGSAEVLENNLSADLTDRITEVKTLFSQPETLVSNPQDFQALQRVIIERVAAKIAEINNLCKEVKNIEVVDLLSAVQTECEEIVSEVFGDASSVVDSQLDDIFNEDEEPAQQAMPIHAPFQFVSMHLINDPALVLAAIHNNAWNSD